METYKPNHERSPYEVSDSCDEATLQRVFPNVLTGSCDTERHAFLLRFLVLAKATQHFTRMGKDSYE